MITRIRSLREEVYEHLRALMHHGQLRPGDELDLNALAAGIGISRTPLIPIPDRKSTRLNSSHIEPSRMPSSA